MIYNDIPTNSHNPWYIEGTLPEMIKKIDVSELGIGMYVHDLCRHWIEHPFMRNQFLVRSAQDIEEIVKLGVRDIYIDTAQGLDVSPVPPSEPDQKLSTDDLHG